MMGLVEFLRQRLNEDERIARATERYGQRWGYHEDGYVIFYPDEPEPFMYSVEWPQRAEHIARHDPARILRDVESKRRILDEHYLLERKVNWTDEDGEDRQHHQLVCVICVPKYAHIEVPAGTGPCTTLRLLALPYADHQDYRQEWAPAA